MDNDAENVEENEKYSFLLASAIRNEDPEQFFSIYDSILPKNLPDIQVNSNIYTFLERDFDFCWCLRHVIEYS
jgi:hypothetical protein